MEIRGLNLGVAVFCFIVMAYHVFVTHSIAWVIVGLLAVGNMWFAFWQPPGGKHEKKIR
jgi:Zn-dependent protease